MDQTNNYLLLLIGILVVALIAVYMIPLPEAPAPVQLKKPVPAPVYKPPKLSSATIASVTVLPTSSTVTVTVV